MADDDRVQCFCIDHGIMFPKRDRFPLRCTHCNREVEPCRMANVGPDTDSKRMQDAYYATRKPAPKSAIDHMRELEMTEDMLKTEVNCPICTDPMEVGTTVKAMECGHFFHGHCIVEWLGKRNVCPLCGATLFQKYPARYKGPHGDGVFRTRGDGDEGGDGASSSSYA